MSVDEGDEQMNKWKVITMITVLLFTAGCAAGGSEPAVSTPSTSADPSSGGALSTVAPTEMSASPTEQPTERATAEAGANEPAATESGAVAPVTVDLSQLTPEPPASGTPQELPAPGIPNPQMAMIQKVSMDLAERLQVDISEIEVVNATGMEWNDSSLGCPEPGMGYLMVITPGFQITLRASGETYTYHTNQTNHFVLCGPNNQPVPSPSP
jgi:hypothetical protein